MLILPISYDIMEAAGHVHTAKKAGVTIRPRDTIFAVQGANAFACVRMIKPRWARLCGCFVGKEFRGHGLGTALIAHRLEFIHNNTAAEIVDTFAFRKPLFLSLGFKEIKGFKIGTTQLRLTIDRGRDMLCKPGIKTRTLLKTERASVYHGDMSDCTFNVDMIASDPPWRQGNLSYWSHQAGIKQQWLFMHAMSRHFINPIVVYLKVGVPEASQWIDLLKQAGLNHIATWQTTYFGGVNAQIVAARKAWTVGLPRETESKQATTSIAAWAKMIGIETVADPCVGKGVMLAKFLKAGMHVIGVELIESRAATAAATAARNLC